MLFFHWLRRSNATLFVVLDWKKKLQIWLISLKISSESTCMYSPNTFINYKGKQECKPTSRLFQEFGFAVVLVNVSSTVFVFYQNDILRSWNQTDGWNRTKHKIMKFLKKSIHVASGCDIYITATYKNFSKKFKYTSIFINFFILTLKYKLSPGTGLLTIKKSWPRCSKVTPW